MTVLQRVCVKGDERINVTEVAKAARLEKHRAMVKERESSGQSITEWCKENGVGRSLYYFWQKEVFAARKSAGQTLDGNAQTEPASVLQPTASGAKAAFRTEDRKKYCARRVMECRGSGKTVKDWCKENGVGLTTFYNWQKEAREDLLKIMEGLNRALPCPEPQKPALPAPVAPEGWAICEPAPPPAESGQPITIEIGKGRITATADADSALLTKVCRILVAL